MKKIFKFLIIWGSIVLALALCLIFNSKRLMSPPAGDDSFAEHYNSMIISSSAFANGQAIPTDYGCQGADINPPLEIKAVPAAAQSLALLVDDPDAPAGDWVHWIVWNIDPQTMMVPADSLPLGSVVGLNDFGTNRYDGPCPPQGTHRYQFKLYALDTKLDLPIATQKSGLLPAMAGHILDQAILVGTYSK